MNLKIVLLTTETAHHTYYAWRLAQEMPLHAIWIETKSSTPAFEVFHPFEAERDAYEREVLLAGRQLKLPDLAPTQRFESATSANSVAALQSLAPDILLVFGTGRLLPPVIRCARVVCLNLHGGDPEWYRGLDSHLWTIHQEDFEHLVTTLHIVDDDLDTGPIVGQIPLKVSSQSRLPMLRSINTQACVDLSLQALSRLQTTGALPSREQTRRGVYRSFMPAALKESCVEKFKRHVAQLPHERLRLVS